MASIPRIMIDQQIAEIGIHNTPAQLRIIKPRYQMSIKTEMPQMEIDRRAPTFKVNRRKINTESGLKPPAEFTKAFRDKGRVGAFRGMKTPGEEGDFLGDLRRPGDRVAQLARSKAMARATRQAKLDMKLMPQTAPEVVWDKGHMSINWSKHSIVIDWDGEYMPQVTIDPKHSIEVYLRTRPHFRLTVENPGNQPGRYVDQAI